MRSSIGPPLFRTPFRSSRRPVSPKTKLKGARWVLVDWPNDWMESGRFSWIQKLPFDLIRNCRPRTGSQ